MQSVVFDKPYRFVPPHRGRLWPALLRLILRPYLRQAHGVTAVECLSVERLRASISAGHGVLLAPNHCRDCDPMVLALLAGEAGRDLYVMASAHLFMQGGLLAWLLPRAGAFSVYREGMDRAALAAASGMLEAAERPLVIFPEGVISRTNERLNALMEGPALIARAAAKKRAKAAPPGRVVAHPVAIRYVLLDDPAVVLPPAIEDIELRLSWRPQRELPLAERVYKVGEGLLSLKEVEFLGSAQPGRVPERLRRLTDHLLEPLEKEWVGGQKASHLVARLKRLRAAILPDVVKGGLDEKELERRWRHLAELDLVQQLDHYPPDYIRSKPTPERLLETVERFEEDLTGKVRVLGRLRAVVEVGEALPAEGDGLMDAVQKGLERLLGIGGA